MPQLPNVNRAIIDPRKIADYLLDDTHPDGGPKARFLKRFGFSSNDPGSLRDALLSHAGRYDVSAEHVTKFGVIHEVVGRLETPDRRNPIVKVVWMTGTGADWPRLITLVPKKGQKP